MKDIIDFIDEVVVEQEELVEATKEAQFQLDKIADAERNAASGLQELKKIYNTIASSTGQYNIEYPRGYKVHLNGALSGLKTMMKIHKSMEKLASRFDK